MEENPVPGQRAWLHAAIPPWLDKQYEDTMRDHGIGEPEMESETGYASNGRGVKEASETVLGIQKE